MTGELSVRLASLKASQPGEPRHAPQSPRRDGLSHCLPTLEVRPGSTAVVCISGRAARPKVILQGRASVADEAISLGSRNIPETNPA